MRRRNDGPLEVKTMLPEDLVKAQQTVNLLVSDLRHAWRSALSAGTPNLLPSASWISRGLAAYLEDCLDLATQLERKLTRLYSEEEAAKRPASNP